PDAEDDGEHNEGAAAEGTDTLIDRDQQILGRIEPMRQDQVAADIEHHARNKDRIVDELRPVPLHGVKAGAHGFGASVACGVAGSGGGRNTSAIPRPSATARASTGHTARWTDRWARLIGATSASA